jgi:DNA-binding YbaB/EbfC family protein
MTINPFELIKNAGAIKEQLANLKDEMETITSTGSSGGGIVKVTINGKFQITNIQLDPIAVDSRDIPMLQDLIIAAHNQAVERIGEIIKEKLGPMANAFNVPGMGI